MRFLRNPHRDARLLQTQSSTGLATSGVGHNVQPKMRASSTSVATNYAMIYGNGSQFDFGASKQYGAGVFIRGPGNDGSLFKFYRVIMSACTFDDHLHPMPVWGVGPDSPVTGTGGNSLTNFQHLGGPVSSEGGNSLYYDDLVKVKPFTGNVADNPICFGVVIYNDHTSGINDKAYNYHISVLREGGEVPDALARHDL